MTNATTRGVFDTSGNFGIGTDAPGATLDVRGGAIFNEAGAAVDFRIEGDAQANLLFVDGSADKIGIGTATPGALLDIDNGGATTQLLMCVNGCICAAGFLGQPSGHCIQDAGSACTQRLNLNFSIADVGTVVDNPSGNATVICINGSNTCVPFLMADGSTSDPISLAGGSIGNALCNDSNPTLGGLMCGAGENICAVCCICITGCYFGDGSQLSGGVVIPSKIAEDCTVIGCNAGGNVAAGATNVVIYGGSAGYNVTTADNIVLIGSTAALCMTTATDQVIVGTKAGRCVLTCAGNVAVGAHAFYNECAGTYNTVIGDCAGYTQKGAARNTFIGALAGALDSTGSGNVFIGYKAGCANSSGSCCLVIGNGTCDIITGAFNTPSLTLDADTFITNGKGMVIGHTAQVAVAGATTELQVLGTTTAADGSMTLGTWSTTNSAASYLHFLKSGNATIGSNTIVADDEDLGGFVWAADDGTDYASHSAYILAAIDGTPGSNDVPGRLVFATTPDGAAGSTERMRITSAGYVGIGTTAPDTKLHVFTGSAGSVTPHANADELVVENSADAGISILSPDASVSYLNFAGPESSAGAFLAHSASNGTLSMATNTAGDQIIFSTAGNVEAMRIDASQHIGIEKTPSAINVALSSLEIGSHGGFSGETSSAASNSLFITSNAYNNTSGTWTYGINDQAARLQIADGMFIFANAAAGTGAITFSEAMRIDPSGNMGIGTATPAGRLAVTNTTTTLDRAVQITHSGARTAASYGIILDNTSTSSTASIAKRGINVTSTGTWNGSSAINSGVYVTASGGTTNYGIYSVAADNYFSGNVGIGVTAPADRLDVAENQNAASYMTMNNTTAGTASVAAFRSVASGSANLSGYSFSESYTTSGQYIADGTLLESGSASSGGLGISQAGALPIMLYTNGAERMRIDSAGKVGIGVAAPGQTLAVEGTATTTGDARYTASLTDDTSMAIGVGGGLGFRGSYTGTTATELAAIWAQKENGTSSNYAGNLHLGTRIHGGDMTEAIVIDSAQKIKNPVDNAGFYTGAGDDLRMYHDGTSSRITSIGRHWHSLPAVRRPAPFK